MKKYKKIDYNAEDLSVYDNSDLKKIADYWLRQYLLRNHANQNGKYYCPLKRRWYSEDKIQVAHHFDRGCMSTRYNLINCSLISSDSNMWDAQVPYEGYKSKHHFEYEEYLRNAYGDKIFEELEQESKIIRIFARQDYIGIIEKFRNNE